MSTGGASPTLARVVRDELERLVPESYGLLLEVVAAVRARVRRAGTRVPADRWRAAIDDRLRALVAEGQVEQARRCSRRGWRDERPGAASSSSAPGRAIRASSRSRGLELLRQADVVVHDRLVSPALLDEAAAPGHQDLRREEPGRRHVPGGDQSAS